LPYFSAIFDREISDFYSWTIPKEDYLIMGAAGFISPSSAEGLSYAFRSALTAAEVLLNQGMDNFSGIMKQTYGT
jgi:flavin-dependent dehydrogenase